MDKYPARVRATVALTAARMACTMIALGSLSLASAAERTVLCEEFTNMY